MVLNKPGIQDTHKAELEQLRDLVDLIRGLFNDRLSDLLGIHQALIYEYLGGPEMISTAMVSPIEVPYAALEVTGAVDSLWATGA